MQKLASLFIVPILASTLLLSTSPSAAASGSNGGSGGNPPPAGPIGNVGLTPNPLIGGRPGSVFVAFTFADPTPAAGVDLALRANDAALQVPATYHVPGGVLSVDIPMATTDVAAQRTVSVTISSGAQSKVASATLLPSHPAFVPVKLQSPGDGSSFGFRRQIKFGWAAQTNVAYYDIQVAADPAFATVVAESGALSNVWGADYFDGTGLRYWRVRAMDASSNPGPWSATWRFTVKPQ